MGKGAVHPHGSNFRRFPCRFDIVYRMRKLVAQNVYERPKWLEMAERAPPTELHSLNLCNHSFKNPYPPLVNTLLSKYPELRFQDCYSYGNEWSKGIDRYRNDHPVMQFVARQLDFIYQGYSRNQSFLMVENWFRERRLALEKKTKLMMASAVSQRVDPIFTSPHAYWQSAVAEEQARHLLRIRNVLRGMRTRKLIEKGKDKSDLHPRITKGKRLTEAEAVEAAFQQSLDESIDDVCNIPRKYTSGSTVSESIPENQISSVEGESRVGTLDLRNIRPTKAAAHDPFTRTRFEFRIDDPEFMNPPEYVPDLEDTERPSTTEGSRNRQLPTPPNEFDIYDRDVDE